MRLHRLRVEAFGPFAGGEEVDFDALADAGLFLLHGPTGAGKTSVLDAVCFALYGQVPGARAGGRPRLRSDHAADGVPPRVVLELTVGGRRLEVTRSPEWQRPKKRGAGTTREPASCDVRELVDGSWQTLVGRRSDEAGLLLRELLGMGLDQFTKVVLLPQGEFAAFLRAGAEQRAELLGRLFDIDRFGGVEQWLRDERQRLARQVADVDAERDQLVARALEMAGSLSGSTTGIAPLAPEAEMALAAPPGPEVVEALAAAAHEEARAAGQRAATAREVHAAADVTCQSQRTIAERRQRHDELADRLARLDRRAGELQQVSQRLTMAERAAPLRAMVARHDETAAALAGAQRALDAAEPGGARTLDEADIEAALQARRDDLRRALDGATLVDEHIASSNRLDGLLRRRDEADQRLTAATERCQVASDRQAALQAVLDEQGAVAASGETARQRLEAAQAALVAAEDLRGCEADLVARQDARRTAHDAELTARSVLVAVREQRLDGMAAELAARLAPGEPCEVCGATEHPRPAPTVDGAADEAAERAAAQAAQEASNALRAAERAVAEAERQQALLTAAAGGLDVAAAKAQVDHCVAEAQRALAALADVERARSELQEAQRTMEAAVQDADDARAELLTAAAGIAEVEPRVAEMAAAVGALLGDDADVATRTGRLQAEIATLEARRTALREVAAAAARSAELRTAVDEALTEAGFEGLDDVRAALLPAAEVQRLRDEVAAVERERADVRALLSSPELTEAAAADAPTLAAAEECLQRAQEDLRVAERAAAVADQADRALQRLALRAREHDDVNRELRRHAAHVDELSRCVDGTGGGNTRRMRLTAFVLAARLEEVAAAASDRLLLMSDGRYTLEHTDALARGGARSGLGLQVVDGWTGVARETTTLSGGESFLASLSLALGLADVVQAEAAGSAIETLFVDEGFGTLDEETLEEVMSVLDGLREGGRAVGLVSHVADLQARITAQVEVRKGRRGSTLSQHPGGASERRSA